MSFCFYCNRTLNDRKTARRGDRNKGLDFTKDHKTPLARGGRTTRANIVPCCHRCNNLKGDMTANEFRGYVLQYGYENQPKYIKERMKYELV
jgi:5-methylcytosine-specific restriction endonuclease McrA